MTSTPRPRMPAARLTPRLAILSLAVLFVCALSWPLMARDDASDLFDRGRELMADRNYAAAGKTFALLASKHPEAGQRDAAILLLGKAHLYGKQYDAALTTFERLLDENAKSEWAEKARLLMADAYTAKGRHQLASDILKRRLETVEGRAYKLMLAQHYLAIAEAAERGVASTDPLKRGKTVRDLEKAIRYFTKARELLVGEREEAELTVRIARAEFDRGQPQNAINSLNGFFERYPDFTDAAGTRILLARALLATGRTRDVREQLIPFEKEGGLYENHAARQEALELYAESYYREAGERAVEKGVRVAERAIAVAPAVARAKNIRFRLGQAQYQTGALQPAIEALEAFRARHAEDKRAADALLMIADARVRMNEFDRARDAWKTFIATYPNHTEWASAQRKIVEALFQKAADLGDAKDRNAAIAAYEAFLREYPADRLSPSAQFAIAQHHEKAKRIDAAITAYATAATRYAKLDRNIAARAQLQRAQLLRLEKQDFAAAMKQLQDLLARFNGTNEANIARVLIGKLSTRELVVETSRVFTPGEKPSLEVNTRNLTSLTVRAYTIDLAAYFEKKKRIDRIESVEVRIIQPAVEWTHVVDEYAKYKDIEFRLPLDRLAERAKEGGAFIVSLRGDDLECRTLVMLSNLTLVLKAAPKEALAFVLDEASGRPAADVEVAFSDGGKILGRAKTDASGIAKLGFKNRTVGAVYALAKAGRHLAFSGGKNQGAYSFGYRTKAYLYTDRPRYRPGHTMSFKGILRRVRGGAYETPKNVRVTVQVYDSRGALLLQEKKKTNAFGTISGSLPIGRAAPLGNYRVVARFDRNTFESTFEVAEYKKPEMFVRVKPKRSDYLNGERVHANVEAGYYFGGPVKKGAVRWWIYRTPFTFDSTGYKEYAWFFEDQAAKKPSRGGLGELVVQGSGETDDKGELAISFETGDKTGDWRYTVAAQVTGRGRSIVQGQSPLFVTERAFYALVKSDKKAYQPKEAMRVTVTTVDARHAPVARTGRVELVRITRRKGSVARKVTSSEPITTGENGRGEVTLRAPRGGRYQLRFVGEDRRKETVSGHIAVDVAGDAEDLDRQARIVAEREIYYTGDVAKVLVNTPKAPTWALLTFEGERVLDHRVVRLERRSTMLDIPMKGNYAPNVFLRVAIAANHELFEDEDEILVFKFLKVDITASGQLNQGATFKPGEKVRYDIRTTDPKGKPVQAELSLAVVDQSLLAISNDPNKSIKPFFYDQKRKRSVRTSSSLSFKYAARTSKVDADLLGMEARARLKEAQEKMADFAKQNVNRLAIERGFSSGEALGKKVADARFKADAPGAPRPSAAASISGFRTKGGGRASPREEARKSKSRLFREGRSADDKVPSRLAFDLGDTEEPEMDADVDSFGWRSDRALAAVETRSRFLDTAAWRPHVATDGNGEATVEITLPDNLTTWRAKAVGVGGAALVGSSETMIRVSKPLAAKLDTPRFLTQGDRARVSGVLHNNTNESGPHRARLTVEGATRATGETNTVTIEGTGSARLDWDIETPASGPVKFKLQAMGPTAEDGTERGLPAHPFGIRGRVARSGTTTESTTLTFDLPDGVIVGTERFGLLLSPGYDTVILDALDYLAGFPYGCLEQTVSRFVPAVVCANALREMGIHDPARAEALGRRVQAGLARLYHMQRPDGGWGWWYRPLRSRKPVGGSDPRMTAYALLGLEIARKAGYAVDNNVLTRARKYAQNLAQKAGGYDLRAALLHALSINRAVSTNGLNRAYRYRDLLTSSGLARLALAYDNIGRAAQAATLAQLLEQKAVRKGGLVSWPFSGKRCGGWDRSVIENTAYAAAALLATDPDNSLIDPAIAFLLAHRRGRAFGTTKDTSATLFALGRFAQVRGVERADYTLNVTVNGKPGSQMVVRGGKTGKTERTIVFEPALFRAGKNVVRLEKNGPGRINYAFLAEHYTPADTVKAAGNVLRIKRRYAPHQEPTAGGPSPVKAGWSVVIPEFRPRKTAAATLRDVRVGRQVEVHVTVTAREALRFVMLEDPLPAGFEVVLDSATGKFDRFERRDDRAVFFFSSLAKVQTVSYRLQAIHPGAYRARASFAAPMYEPEVWGRSASHAIKILDDTAGNIAVAKREPTADELYYGGIRDDDAHRNADARKKLRAVLAYRLQDQYRDEALARLIRLELQTAPKAALTAFEELTDRNPRKAKFARPTRIKLAAAYHRVNEFERSAANYRELLNESFRREQAVAKTYADLGQPTRAQDVLARILRRYPDQNAVISASYKRGLAYAQIPSQRFAVAKSAAYAKIAAPTMKVAAIRELKAFTGFYPESPLADDAQYEVIKMLGSLSAHDHATAEAARFQQRYPKSRWLDDVLHLAMESLYASGQYDAALKVGRRLIREKFARDNGRGRATSKWRNHAIYLHAKIYHIRGDLNQAVANYRRVASKFNDARDAVQFFTRKELTAPTTVSIATGAKAEVEITAKNLKHVKAKVYPVDLEILFALRKNLRNVNAIDLTGIPAVAEIEQKFASPPVYRQFRTKVSLPIEKTGVYLVLLKSGEREASTIVVVSELELKVQRAQRTVRIYVTRRADGTPVAGATVRIADGRRIIAEGRTDPRGVYEGPAISGAVSVVARDKGDKKVAGSFAFYQEKR